MSALSHDAPADGLDQTADALDGGVTALTPTAALATIERWRDACLADETLGLEAVAAGLDTLHGLLSADRLDGRAIARTLAGLADATAAVRPGDASVVPDLDRLAAALHRAAGMLGA